MNKEVDYDEYDEYLYTADDEDITGLFEDYDGFVTIW